MDPVVGEARAAGALAKKCLSSGGKRFGLSHQPEPPSHIRASDSFRPSRTF